jgi:hypothetical protein
MNLKTATVIAFAGLAVFVIVLRFSDRHAGTSTCYGTGTCVQPTNWRNVPMRSRVLGDVHGKRREKSRGTLSGLLTKLVGCRRRDIDRQLFAIAGRSDAGVA